MPLARTTETGKDSDVSLECIYAVDLTPLSFTALCSTHTFGQSSVPTWSPSVYVNISSVFLLVRREDDDNEDVDEVPENT
jgi:hypothetical protein